MRKDTAAADDISLFPSMERRYGTAHDQDGVRGFPLTAQ
jgi:hypothetical protein